MAAEGVVPPFHLIMPFFSQINTNQTTIGPIGLKRARNIAGAPRMCLFKFDINRTSSSQVKAIYLSTNDRTRCYDVTNDVTINVYLFIIIIYFFCTIEVTILLLRLV